MKQREAIFGGLSWPAGRPPRAVGAPVVGEWHHSDVRAVAYTFTYKLFYEIVAVGNLK